MTRFIDEANLPTDSVKSVVCGVLCRELEDYLDSRGIVRYHVSPNPNIDKAVANHPDMLLIHLGGNKLVVDNGQDSLISQLNNIGARVIPSLKPISGSYPNDIALNFTLVGEYAFGKFDCCDENLLSELKEYKKSPCKQGYCKCSTLIINHNAIITDDSSIYKTALKSGIDALFISKGGVSLPGHDYGFIGGASAKISKDEVLFFGDITKHSDYKKIADFINKHGCKIISLDFPLTDYGGLVLLTQD